VKLRKATKIDLLKAVPLFAGCSRAELAQIARWVDEVVVPERTVLMCEGETGRELYARGRFGSRAEGAAR
jgi:hypothetical protein